MQCRHRIIYYCGVTYCSLLRWGLFLVFRKITVKSVAFIPRQNPDNWVQVLRKSGRRFEISFSPLNRMPNTWNHNRSSSFTQFLAQQASEWFDWKQNEWVFFLLLLLLNAIERSVRYMCSEREHSELSKNHEVWRDLFRYEMLYKALHTIDSFDISTYIFSRSDTIPLSRRQYNARVNHIRSSSRFVQKK